MNNPGQLFIWLGLMAVGVSCLSYFALSVNKNFPGTRWTARLCFVVFSLCVTLAGIWLMRHILNNEFGYRYVAQYSSRDLPLIYRISSFWAGQEGSFLLWVCLAGWLGMILMFTSGRHEFHVMFIYNLANLFLMVLLIKQSPFGLNPMPPADGNGLNMLLQDPWMVIHPPIVFLGYAAYAIPNAYAISAFWKKEYDSWIRPGLPWAILAYVVLGAGIIIGGVWSYKVLGWGGYWGWDPVENASLLPWLAGTALVHGMILQLKQKRLQKTNFGLAACSFILVIYCTFLTRSGVLADFSVHSFTDMGIAAWLVVYMGVFMAIVVWLFITRSGDFQIRNIGEIDLFSREFGLVCAIVLLGLSCLVTGLGTSAPLITRMMATASKVSTEFYVRTNLPIAVLMLFLLAVVPVMSFGRNPPLKLIKKLTWAVAGAIAGLIAILYYGRPGAGVFLLAVFTGAAIAMNLVLSGRFLRRRFTLSSGALVHLGVGLMFLGIIGSSVYDQSKKVRLVQGESQSVLGTTITLTHSDWVQHGKGQQLKVLLQVKKGDHYFTAEPDIYLESGSAGTERQFVHPFIKRGLLSDFYISPVAFDPDYGDEPPSTLTIKKGETVHRSAYVFTFEGYDISRGMAGAGAQSMQVGAKITVAYKNKTPVLVTPILDVGRQADHQNPVQLPGPSPSFIRLTHINANAGTITLAYDGPPDSGADPNKEVKDQQFSVILEFSVKPGMTGLWAGTFLMLFGGVVGIIRHRHG